MVTRPDSTSDSTRSTERTRRSRCGAFAPMRVRAVAGTRRPAITADAMAHGGIPPGRVPARRCAASRAAGRGRRASMAIADEPTRPGWSPRRRRAPATGGGAVLASAISQDPVSECGREPHDRWQKPGFADIDLGRASADAGDHCGSGVGRADLVSAAPSGHVCVDDWQYPVDHPDVRRNILALVAQRAGEDAHSCLGGAVDPQ
jgi:hypothetical protein